MIPVLTFVVELVLSVSATAWVVRRDMRSLDAARLARGWNGASFWSAVVVFAPLCILVHFVRTRRSFSGALLGLFWVALVLVATSAASSLVEALLT